MYRYIILAAIVGSAMLVKGCISTAQVDKAKVALQTVVSVGCNKTFKEREAIVQLCSSLDPSAQVQAACNELNLANNDVTDACDVLTEVDALIEAVDAAKAQ